MSVPSSLGLPLLTIAIPTFNRAGDVTRLLHCIEQELESLTPGDVAVLVSDNASDDGTACALAEQAQTRPWLRVHRQRENLGAVGNTAWLIENAPESEHDVVLGGDELLVPGSLASILGVLRGERPAWMFLPHAWVDDAGNRTAGSPAPGAVERFGSPGELYQAYHQWLTFLSASITRTDALRESVARGNSENLYQPLLWYFGAALGGSCVVGPDVVVLAGMSVSLLGREHIVLTEHFTSMYDDG